ncbi:Protein ALP1-like protein, partial [Cucurbita argyrosperma subsp. sororia]
MGPIRGFKRKKQKKAQKKVVQYVFAAASLSFQPQPLDWWDEFSQRITGPLSQFKNTKFESVFKISRKTFSYICSLVKEAMMAKTSNFTDLNGKPLSLNDQVAVALRRLCSGESLSNIGDSFGMNQSSVSQITWRFVEAMEEKGIRHLSWPSTEEDMDQIKSKFKKIRGLPNCCGVIETTHIMMTLPTTESANGVWLDREKNCSMILQVIVDPEMRFCDIITGWPGSLSDALVLESSGFFKRSQDGERLNGKKMKLSESAELGEYIIGDSGFPLLPWLLTPYQGKGLADYQTEFNKRHFGTRLVAQRALTRLKEMWKIIKGIMWKPDKHKLPRIILVCCLLHNIMIDMEDEMQDEMPLSHHHDPSYRQQSCKFVDNTASITREKLSMYLSEKLTH